MLRGSAALKQRATYLHEETYLDVLKESLPSLICKHLGVEIGEVWKSSDGNKYCITKDGDIYLIEQGHIKKEKVTHLWEQIISGKLTVDLNLSEGDKYWTPDLDSKKGAVLKFWRGCSVDKHRLDNNLVFRTEAEAIKYRDRMLNSINVK